MIANVQGLPLTREGFFAVIVESEGQEIGRRNLYVEQVREGGPHV